MMMKEGDMRRIFVNVIRDNEEGKIINGDIGRGIEDNEEKRNGGESKVLKNGKMGKEIEMMEKNEKLEKKIVKRFRIICEWDEIEDNMEVMIRIKKVDEEDKGGF